MNEYNDIMEIIRSTKRMTGEMLKAPAVVWNAGMKGVRGMKKLIFMLEKLTEKGILSRKDVSEYENFIRDTKNNVVYYDVPCNRKSAEKVQEYFQLNTEAEKERSASGKNAVLVKADTIKKEIAELEELDAQRIRYYLLPNLKEGSSSFQVCVDGRDKILFNNWYSAHLYNQLNNGGEMSYSELEAFTEGNTTVKKIKVSYEEEKKQLAQDLAGRKISFGFLDDPDPEDGFCLVAVANKDVTKFNQYLELELQDRLHPKDVSYNELANDSILTPEKYIDKYLNLDLVKEEVEYRIVGEEKVAGRIAKYDEWMKEFSRSSALQTETNINFFAYREDPAYHMVTIDRTSLVDRDNFCQQLQAKLGDENVFVSRIPGTFGARAEYLVLPRNQVFEYNDGRSLAAFIDDRTMILSKASLKAKQERKSFSPFVLKDKESIGASYEINIERLNRLKYSLTREESKGIDFEKLFRTDRLDKIDFLSK